ncbi:MAG TPA: hypothetical protein VJT67_03890 [Longimicrobiaceae bacterium]|nr:hypothetical protein [Longimicrobiaceae bacterium]
MRTMELGFSRPEIEFLQQPSNLEMKEWVVRCLNYLGDLVQRYTGSMFLVRIPDEAEALRFLEQTIAHRPSNSPFEENIQAGYDAYRRIRAMFEEQGLSPAVQELAQVTADDLLAMWCWATSQPGFRLGIDERGWTQRTS